MNKECCTGNCNQGRDCPCPRTYSFGISIPIEIVAIGMLIIMYWVFK